MDVALAVSAFLMGLAGAPHCAAMCGPSCAGVLAACSAGASSRAAPWTFHLARVAGYALAGAVAATGTAALAWAGAATPVLRPLWTLLHAAALLLGLWMAWTGQQPAWMTLIGHGRLPAALAAGGPTTAAGPVGGWQRMAGPGAAAAAGMSWVAWPCGLLQSALVVAALANSAWGGALAMACFAAASAVGLQSVPWLLRRKRSAGVARGRLAGGFQRWSSRFSGLLLAAAALWALGHDFWRAAWAYCLG